MTLRDVAKVAGVSLSTASSVLSGSTSNTRVSPPTRERILSASEELGYRANGLARSLRRKTADLFGVYLGGQPDDIGSTYIGDVLTGIQHGCSAHRKDLVVFSGLSGRTTDQLVQTMVDGRLDGMILHPTLEDDLVRKLAHSGFPCVAVTNTIVGVPAVTVDDAGGIRALLRHLMARGHRRLWYRDSPLRVSSVRRRLSAIREFCAANGMELTVTASQEPDDGMSADELALLALPRAGRPTAAVCWQDHSAYVLKSVCDQSGLSVPADLAITGFNGYRPPVPLAYRLTTIDAPFTKAASTAVELLTDIIGGKSVPSETVLPIDLVEGDTT